MLNIKELQQKFDELFADVNADDNFKVFVQNKINAESTPTHGRTAEEVLKPMVNKIGYNYENILNTEGFANDILNIAIKAINQAMHDFRTQPQQVREEVSAEDIKEALTKIMSLCDNENPTHEQIWHIAHDALQSHPVNTGDGWVKVEDRLPSHKERVI